MREISVNEITAAVRNLAISANTDLGQDVVDAFHGALEHETSPAGKNVLERLIENAEIARNEKIPICQDTGMAVVFVEIGQDIHVTGGSLEDAINEGVRQGYKDGFLRKSVSDPITRENTGDNTPAVIHYEILPGDRFKLLLAPKGFGAENMSRVTMLAPSAGIDGIKAFVVNRVKAAGPNPCPPTIVGVGIGGTLERAALLSKKALMRPLGSQNPDPKLNTLETEWLEEINRLGIGPQVGGRTTSLGVHINTFPCHIASISLAVNLQCHASRHKEIAL
ncbi:fumarate hydratase [Thermodesulfobacteriota bacterium]